MTCKPEVILGNSNSRHYFRLADNPVGTGQTNEISTANKAEKYFFRFERKCDQAADYDFYLGSADGIGKDCMHIGAVSDAFCARLAARP
jgi:hypothetical protein